jgi:hypothetical protein
MSNDREQSADIVSENEAVDAVFQLLDQFNRALVKANEATRNGTRAQFVEAANHEQDVRASISDFIRRIYRGAYRTAPIAAAADKCAPKQA